MSLRTLLILVGIAIVIAVYWCGARRRQRDSRVAYGRRFGRTELPDIVLSHADDEGESDATAETEPGVSVRVLPPRQAPAAVTPQGRLPPDVVLPPQHVILDELPVVRNDVAAATPEPSNARRRVDQMDLFGVVDAPTPAKRAPARAARAGTEAAPPASADDGLVTLYVRAREGQHFAGATLVRALNAVGLEHGEMDIFHHFGAGDLKCATAVFGAANMFEPGTFDLARIEAFRTAGIVLFLQLPAPLDGPVAFELLLNTAQRLTELIGGELYGTPQARLDARSIQRLRARAALFPHART